MPDEDPIIGTPSETPATQSQESSQPATPTESSSPETSNGEAEITSDGAKPLQTVGDAFNAFKNYKQETNSGVAKQALPSGTVAPAKKPRDYSGLEPHEVSWFKNMGGQAFDALKPQLLAYKKMQKEFEDLKKNSAESSKNSFFEHEQAFQLTPEYQASSKNLQQINQEAVHWQKQLASIRAGQTWQPLVLDDKGNVVIGEAQEATPDGEAVIMNALTQAHILKSNLSEKMNGIQTSFKGQHQNFLKQLKDVDTQIFAGADQTALSEAMKTKLPLFPQYMHGNQLVQSLAKALVVVDGLVAMLNEKKAATTTQTIKAKTAANAGPNSGDMQPATTVSGGKVGNVWDEFKQARMTGMA